MGFRLFNAVLLVCFVGSIALAQSERAVIGTVFDETGAVLPGVTVESGATLGSGARNRRPPYRGKCPRAAGRVARPVYAP